MTFKTFCSVCLSASPCEGDVIMKLWGICAIAARPTDRAGPPRWPLSTPLADEPLLPQEALSANACETSVSVVENQRRN